MSWSSRPIAISLLSLFASVLLCARDTRAQITKTEQASPPSASSSSVPHSKKPVPKKKKRTVHRRRKIQRTADPGKIVVRHGGTTEALPQMTPSAPKPQESSERKKSGDLLTATDANLKSLGGKKLTPDQQETVSEIRQFMEQSRAALDAGDLTQGYNLANKANVLSEELKRH